jgi:hypothetical protein
LISLMMIRDNSIWTGMTFGPRLAPDKRRP